MNFMPEAPKEIKLGIPFFEDASGRDIPGRWTEKSVAALQSEVIHRLSVLGAEQVFFRPGKFEKRYGYRIEFRLGEIPGRLDVVGLPMKSETPKKKDRVLAQALFLVRDWLQAEWNSLIYRPGSVPLLPFLVGEGGRTVTEALQQQRLPELLPAGPIEGEIIQY